MSDRLLNLSTYRLALRHANLTTPDAVRAATPDQLARLHQYRGELLALVRAGNLAVMRALFVKDPDWQAAILSSDPGVRLLTVTSGTPGHTTTLLSLTYVVDDDGRSEREAWRALCGVLL